MDPSIMNTAKCLAIAVACLIFLLLINTVGVAIIAITVLNAIFSSDYLQKIFASNTFQKIFASDQFQKIYDQLQTILANDQFQKIFDQLQRLFATDQFKNIFANDEFQQIFEQLKKIFASDELQQIFEQLQKLFKRDELQKIIDQIQKIFASDVLQKIFASNGLQKKIDSLQKIFASDQLQKIKAFASSQLKIFLASEQLQEIFTDNQLGELFSLRNLQRSTFSKPEPLPHEDEHSPIVTAETAAVATDEERSSAVGRKILEEGGNAVDAAVAAALCLGVVSPASSGIGGGGFMVIRMADGRMQTYDMRGTAPMNSYQAMYNGNKKAKKRGPLSCLVPAELKGLYEAKKKFGSKKMKWHRLVEPAINYARNGFEISPNLHYEMTKVEEYILKDPGLRAIYTDGNKVVPVGTVVKNSKLADTLEAIANEGPDVLYGVGGTIGDALVKDILGAKPVAGILTKNDLMNYEVKVREPLQLGEFRELQLVGMPPPSSGCVGMKMILNILDQYGTLEKITTPLGLHRYVEACKHMFAVRTHLGDPDFVPNANNVVADMLSHQFACRVKELISDSEPLSLDKYGTDKYNALRDDASVANDHGTSHISIIDGERNAVALTTSLGNYFGGVFLSPNTGILLDNGMDAFSLDTDELPGHPNHIYPGKRPLSSMTPTIILKDGQLKGVIGGSGGLTIIGGTTEVFLNYFVGEMEQLAAVKRPRFYHKLMPGKVDTENSISGTGESFEADPILVKSLEEKGHITSKSEVINCCQFIVHDFEELTLVEIIQSILTGISNCDFEPLCAAMKGVSYGELTAVSDPRKGGVPKGY